VNHPGDELLNDFADSLLDARGEADVAAHLRTCAECQARVDAIRSLSARLASLPREIAPSRDLRPTVGRAGKRVGAAMWLRAAVITFVAAAAAIGFLRTRLDSGPDAERVTVAAASVDAYAIASDDLRAAFESDLSRMDAGTERVFETSLAAVDEAIIQLESARARHPGDATLGRLLETQQRTRLELLRAAMAAASGID
jgi:hypothetical protein